MADRHKVYVLYIVFFVFFAGLLLYGFYIAQLIVSVASGLALLYLAKEMARELYFIDSQERLLHEIKDDIKLVEKNQQDVDKDAYPHVPFFFVHKPNHAYYQKRLDPKINKKPSKDLIKRLATLSRHVETMNDNISYLRKNINHKYLVNTEMTDREIIEEIEKLEQATKTIRYDDNVFIEITKHLIRLHKALILKHRHKNLLENNRILADLVQEAKQELSRFLPGAATQDIENTKL